jgi:DNA-binding CsgD family transcriptional regulator
LRKYGEENFKWEIIDNAETQKELNEKEVYWISFYNSFKGNGYNMTAGGDGASGHKVSEETRYKISISSRNRIRTEEEIRKNIERNTGSNHPRAKLTDEDVLEIKELIKKGLIDAEIAIKFNVTTRQINTIKAGKSWGHLGEDVSNIKFKRRNYTKLNEKEVIEIKLLLKEGKLTREEISKVYNVSSSLITQIKQGKRWGDVGEDLSNLCKHILNEDIVIKIKKLLKNGISRKEIAEMFKVNIDTIHRIAQGKTWKHVLIQ